MWRRLLDLFSSLRLTVVCLALAMVLVFVGTIAQVDHGIHEVQQRYFQSLFIWWPVGTQGWSIPVFPGGHLLLGVLLANLVAAHVRRFRWGWNKVGIQLTHAGLIIILAGVLLTDFLSVESFMRLAPGETKHYSEDPRSFELAVIDGTDPGFDQVTVIPQARLENGRLIEHESLPFRIDVRRFYQNSRFAPAGEEESAAAASTEGVGSRITVKEVSRATAQGERDVPSAVVEITSTDQSTPGGSLGTWLVSDQLGMPQIFSSAGRTWRIQLRPVRYYKPFGLTLREFTHEVYAGTQIPKNFASHAVLVDPEREDDRDVLIYMNHPLRYRGETFFQSGFEQDDSATILQVVYNPGFIAPYLACVIVAAGLLFQFGYHFTGFLRRQRLMQSP